MTADRQPVSYLAVRTLRGAWLCASDSGRGILPGMPAHAALSLRLALRLP